MAKDILLKALLIKEDKPSIDITKDFEDMKNRVEVQWQSVKTRWNNYVKNDRSDELNQGIRNIEGLIDTLERLKKVAFEAQIAQHKFNEKNK